MRGRWNRPDGAEIQSFTIITFEPNELVRNTHDRMPAIMPPRHYGAWLDPKNDYTESLQQLATVPGRRDGGRAGQPVGK